VQVAGGLGYQSEYLLAESNYNHIAIELFNARIEMKKKSDALLNVLNVDTDAVLISSDTSMVPLEMVKGIPDTGLQSFAQYTQARPEYKSMQAELNAIADEKKTTTIGLLMPKLAVGTPDAMLGTFGAPYYNSYRLDAELLWQIPLGRIIYKGDLKIYNNQLMQEQNSMQQFGNDVRQQVEDAKSQILLAMEQMNLSKKALTQSTDALNQGIERERLGTVRPFEVFQTEQFYIQAELDYVKSVGDYNKAQYALYVAMGNNL
jgi:outer membrane protein TolC